MLQLRTLLLHHRAEPGTGITNASTGTFDPATAGAGTHTITYTIAGSCGSSSTTNITVNALPSSAITAAGPFCTGDPATNLTAGTPGGTWSGTGITNASAGTFDPGTAGAGTHTITYSVTDANGCTSSSTATITVNPGPDATITAAGPLCTTDGAITLSAVDPGGTWSGTGITNASTGTFDPATAGAGTHTITYTIPGSCSDTDTETITVTATPAAPVSSSPLTYCAGDPVAPLTAAGSGGTMTWYSDAGLTTVAGTGSPFNSGATASVSYWVTETNGGCEGPATQVNIIINPTPAASQGTVINAGCNDSTGSVTGITASSGTAPYSYVWVTTAGDTVSTSLTTTDLLNAPAGSYLLYVIDANGCWINSGPYIIINTPGITALASATPVTGMAPLAVTFTNNTAGATSYSWNFGDGNTSASASPSHTYTGPGTFNVILTVTDASGCTDTVMITVIVDGVSLMTVPNVFTPNADGINDEFEVTYMGIEEFKGDIYNRWGIKVFSWSDPGTGWDGRMASGSEAPDGTYYYIISGSGVDGKDYAFKGVITLLR
jgi:gliding motility-associated-like protein